MKTIYENELQKLRPSDKVQFTSRRMIGYDFITTMSHGYLVVPVADKNYDKALKICKYGFIGSLACYLEEDCEYGEFATTLLKA